MWLRSCMVPMSDAHQKCTCHFEGGESLMTIRIDNDCGITLHAGDSAKAVAQADLLSGLTECRPCRS